MTNNNAVTAVLRIAVSVILLTVVIIYADINRVVHELSRTNLNYVCISIFCIFISVLIGAINSFILIAREQQISWGQFLPVFWFGWALSLVIPGQIGDIAGISAMLRRYNISWHISIGRSLVDKSLSLIVTVVLAITGLFTVVKGGLEMYEFLKWVSIIGSITFITICILFLVLSNMKIKLDRPGIITQIVNILTEIKIFVIKYPLLITVNFFLTVIKVFLIGISYWAVFKSLGQTGINMIEVILLVATSSLVAYIPISINGLGTVEVVGTWLFSLLSVPVSVVISAYLLLRLIVYLLAWIPASFWLVHSSWRLKEKI